MNDAAALALAISTIEAEAFAAWPAAEVVTCGDWRLRATPGVTRRANSVWLGARAEADPPSTDERERDGAKALERAVAKAEAFYEARGLAPMFQMTPAPGSARLDAFLAARGYATDDSVSVQVARAADVLATTTRGAPPPCELGDEPSATWFEISAYEGRYRDVAPSYRALLERLAPRACFALSRDHGEPAAVGLLVEGTDAAGIFAMQTRPAHRRRGFATATLRALTAALVDRRQAGGAARAAAEDALLYLQVERANAAALALYAACGFRERYRYHYRVRR